MRAVFSAAKRDVDFERLNARADKFAVVSRLYAYLSNGFDYDVAVDNLCLEFRYSKNTIKNLTNPIYRQYMSTLRPYKIYAAHKLKIAGISNKKIAEILNITAPTLSKYLTIKTNL